MDQCALYIHDLPDPPLSAWDAGEPQQSLPSGRQQMPRDLTRTGPVLVSAAALNLCTWGFLNGL